MKNFFIYGTIFLFLFNTASAEELIKQQTKYPDYAYMYLGPDKYEKINRKVFNLNQKMNKYCAKPIHILWASIMPEYGMERIQYAYKNIEYPKRLVSSLIQKDFKTSGTETLRFLTNTTIGIGGMFDPAKHFFNLEPSTEDMEQALCKCKCKCGSYVVLPVVSGTTTRNIAGKILDTALNPTTYIATPILAMVKAGLTVNRTSYTQPLIQMVESTYADPYDISRKMYAIDNYIKAENLDKKEVLENVYLEDPYKNLPTDINPELVKLPELRASADTSNEITVSELAQNKNPNEPVPNSYNLNNSKLMADLILFDFNPQNPVVDSMRTALFDHPEIKKSIWHELSIWNRCFCKKIKISSVNITPNKQNYKFKYLMQKDKNSPLAIIFPSIGEGINSHHSAVWTKHFYDEGYSILIMGSHFQWEFAKSMPDNYAPGIPAKDAEHLKNILTKAIEKLENKYNCEFSDKTLIGTSFGAMTTLFIAEQESKNNTLGISKFISICPPIELTYAMEQVDKNSEAWQKDFENLKHNTAITASKVVQLLNKKENFKPDQLPFSEEEGKLITGFIMHQKLSDLIFTLENTNKNKATDIYKQINNMNYKDYAQKYLYDKNYDSQLVFSYETSLLSISDYLKNNSNYKIYHSVNDYLVNQNQLKNLKSITGEKTLLLNNGAHLGFMYTSEFIKDFKNEIKINQKISSKN